MRVLDSDSQVSLTKVCTSLRSCGFTLVELIVVIVILSILAVTVGMRWNASSSTVPYQAELAARNLRHAQILAMNWGQTLQVEIVSPTNYRIRCAVASITPPCNGVGAIMDPAANTGTFDVTLASGITLTGPATLNFDRLGRPVNPASGALTTAANAYTFSTGSLTYSARVNPITGFVTVQSP